ncbi:GNAT family N-acetyltransferase [Ideonella sp. DXS22W]|uniref:GNAT family N-acetyltransferase n=1 Tax=Pseudaquabacterium inlustre TaxID=2984192 RepID=A0ABU9CMT1_9BURK
MNFDFHQLTLELERAHSRRIALRPVALSDAWPLYQASRNPLFNQHLLWSRPEAEHDVLDRMSVIVEAARKGRLAGISAVVKETGDWISLFRFLPHATRPGAVEMGIWTHDRFWHGRYSLELGRLCVSAAFALSNVDMLVGAAAPENKPSCQLMRLCGLRPLDLVLRDHEAGHKVMLEEFGITRAEWQAEARHRSPFDTVAQRVWPVPAVIGQQAIAAAAESSAAATAARSRHIRG